MAEKINDDSDDRPRDEYENRDPAEDGPERGADDYEITAKDAGWRTPTFLVSRAKITYFDPPRPLKRPAADENEDRHE